MFTHAPSAGKNIIRITLALGIVLFACIFFHGKVYALDNDHSAGETDISTVIDAPGTYDTPEDLDTINTVL